MDKEAFKAAWQQHGAPDANWYPALFYPTTRTTQRGGIVMVETKLWQDWLNARYRSLWLWLHTLKCLVCIVLKRRAPRTYADQTVDIAYIWKRHYYDYWYGVRIDEWDSIVTPAGWRGWWYDRSRDASG